MSDVLTDNGVGVSETRIAICFFGITRSLRYTSYSIDENIIAPAQAFGQTKVFAHFFNQVEIDNPRSGESGKSDVEEYRLLNADWLVIEEPDNCLEKHNFNQLCAYGDTWNDNFVSLRNLVHQLHSLNEVTKAALDWKPDIVLFIRPDLLYHSSLKRYIGSILKCGSECVMLPAWQNWEHGYNDRFAICKFRSAIEAYGKRVGDMHEFCELNKTPLHSERLLRYVLEKSEIKPKRMSARASRVRIGGRLKKENFDGPIVFKLRTMLRVIATRLGMRVIISRLREFRKGK